MTRGTVGLFIVCLALAAPSMSATSAHYLCYGAGKGADLTVTSFDLTLMGTEDLEGATYTWWELAAHMKDGGVFAVRGLSERCPMTGRDDPGTFARYLYLMADGRCFDYRDETTGLAATPRVGWPHEILPAPLPAVPLVDGFASSGTYLGHFALLDRVSVGVEPLDWPRPEVRVLRGDLLIGTARSFRDDGVSHWPDGEWKFVDLSPADYDRLIASGSNYFGAKPEQLAYLEDKAVFIRRPPEFPHDLYRANYVGFHMFSDEPMCLLGFEGVEPDQMYHPIDMANFLMNRVRNIYHIGDHRWGVYTALKRARVDIGNMLLLETDVPTWETEYQTAFYEIAAGATGIVHEGRYCRVGYGWYPDYMWGPGLDVTVEEMLRFYFAWMRGAARAHNAWWGTAIYGQSEPDLRLQAMTLAYDMGAPYIWFWTSDEGHHMTFEQQLTLSHQLMEHKRLHPRGDITPLRDSAELAVALPMGYTVAWGTMYNRRPFDNDQLNSYGVPYGEVVARGLWETVLALKAGVDFDITVEHDGLADLGYSRVIHVLEDGTVVTDPLEQSTVPAKTSLRVEVGLPAELGDPPPAQDPARAAFASPSVDGDLSDWRGADWITLDEPVAEDAAWDGPADLSAKAAFAYDEARLYLAADVRDDVHDQPRRGWSIWKGDCLQFALDPLSTRYEENYTAQDSETGLALLSDGRAICWRFEGRRGLPLDVHMGSSDVVIVRDDRAGRTLYEASIPYRELAPLVPEVCREIGFGLVLNDSDGAERDSYMETVPGAMTDGKHPSRFRTLVFDPPTKSQRAAVTSPRGWASVMWGDNCIREGGSVDVSLRYVTWDEASAGVSVRLEPRGLVAARPARALAELAPASSPSEASVRIAVDAPPGEYRLTLSVRDGRGALMLCEGCPLFVYP